MATKSISHKVTVESGESYFVGGVFASSGVIGLQVLANLYPAEFPSYLTPEYRVNGGDWFSMGSDHVVPSDNFRSVVVLQSGNYDIRFRNTSQESVQIPAGIIIQITHAE